MESNSDTYSDEPQTSGASGANGASYAGHASRLMSVAGALLTVHLEVAKHEVSEEQARIVRGIGLLIVSWMCLFTVILVFQAVSVLALRELFALRWIYCALITMGADLCMWLLLRGLGTRQLKAPVLPATRAMVRKTISALRN